jgi:hypothetical protein
MSRHNISHETIIHAPTDKVWEELIAISDWEWNKWTKLKADKAAEGTKGTLLASYEGNDIWQNFDFEFGPVSESQYLLTWIGSVGPRGFLFSGHHTMQLEAINAKETRLIHREQFGGILPMLGLGLPYKTLKRNYLLMNKALKDTVERNVNQQD